ncbi:DUF4430 domain-containing protein [Cohnella sp. CFH 77786]|nr:DUF4430 domain-containing protein [Cohnella sp. CFH 77786]
MPQETGNEPPSTDPAQTKEPSGANTAEPTAGESAETNPAAAQESGKPAASSPPPSSIPSASKPAVTSPSPTTKTPQTASISIMGNAEWGTVLKPEEVELRKNDTVADLLIRTLKAHRLAYDSRGSGAMFYVAGIDGLFEFDDGPTSGWKYKVNGKEASVGAGAYKLEPGDRVEWFYASQDEDSDQAGKEQAP